jgi:hypothetical protein
MTGHAAPARGLLRQNLMLARLVVSKTAEPPELANRTAIEISPH